MAESLKLALFEQTRQAEIDLMFASGTEYSHDFYVAVMTLKSVIGRAGLTDEYSKYVENLYHKEKISQWTNA